jgi:hypothetical protein
MTVHRLVVPILAALSFGPSAGWQVSTVPSSDASAFMGTWVLNMTNPQGATETVRIWNEDGRLAASLQSGRFPPINVTGVLKDGDLLVLTLTRFENGKRDRAVVSLMLDGGTMSMAQMLEFSETIKRGSGKKQPDAPVANNVL